MATVERIPDSSDRSLALHFKKKPIFDSRDRTPNARCEFNLRTERAATGAHRTNSVTARREQRGGEEGKFGSATEEESVRPSPSPSPSPSRGAFENSQFETGGGGGGREEEERRKKRCGLRCRVWKRVETCIYIHVHIHICICIWNVETRDAVSS